MSVLLQDLGREMISKDVNTPSPELLLVLLIPVSDINSLMHMPLTQHTQAHTHAHTHKHAHTHTHTHTHTHKHSLGVWVTWSLFAAGIIGSLLRVESRVNSTVESGCGSLLGSAGNCWRKRENDPDRRRGK